MRKRATKAILPIAIILLALPLLPLQAHATPVLNTSDTAAIPYGPRASNLVFKYYDGPVDEQNNGFLQGQIDLASSGPPQSNWAKYTSNPDLVLCCAQQLLQYYEVQFNMKSSTWTTWGCDFQNGNSFCGQEIRKAFAHLVDRQAFAALFGDVPVEDPVASDQVPSGSPLAVRQSWDTLDPNSISAYHLANNTSGFATRGSPDFCAARDHLVNAGLGFVDRNNDCIIDNPPSTPIRFMIRNSDPVRLALGNGLMNAINQVFNKTVVTPTYGNARQLGFVFDTSIVDDWDMFTAGYANGPYSDQLWTAYGSLFASNQCPGATSPFTFNYMFICVPAFDAAARPAVNATDVGDFISGTQNALNVFGKHAVTIPVLTPIKRIPYLRSVAGVVNQTGIGPGNYFTALNARADTSYTPANASFAFGGGDPTTLRWGQFSGTNSLNPFWVATGFSGFFELQVFSEVYDTLVNFDPLDYSRVAGWTTNSYQVLPPTAYAPPGALQTIQFTLRPGLQFQDGTPLTSSDVKFSLLNLRDSLSFFAPQLFGLMGVTLLSPTTFQVHMNSPSFENVLNVGTVPILPRHVWELAGDTTYGDVGKADPVKVGSSYPGTDPITNGFFLGSGPFMCSNSTLTGGGCSYDSISNPVGQSQARGGTIRLKAFTGYTFHNNPCPDTDTDGICDPIDTSPGVFSNAFCDTNTPVPTCGSILSRGGHSLTVRDALFPRGVVISDTSPTGTPGSATIAICTSPSPGPPSNVTLFAGSSFVATCGGSIELDVTSGTVQVTFKGTNGQTATSTITVTSNSCITQVTTILFQPSTFSFFVPPTNPAPVTIVVGGSPTTVQPNPDVIPTLPSNAFMTDSEFNPVGAFDAVFTPDQATGTLRLVATNPGTFYYNEILSNVGPTTLTVNETLQIPVDTSQNPYFLLKGSEPVHVYSDLARTVDVTANATISPVQPLSTPTTSVTAVKVKFNIPAGQLRYITIHLTFAKIGTTGYASNAATTYQQGFKFTETTQVGGLPTSQSLFPSTIRTVTTLIGAGKRVTGIGGFALDVYLNPKSALNVKVLSGTNLIGTSIVTPPDGYYFVTTPAGGPYTVQLFNPTTNTVVKSSTVQQVATNQYIPLDFLNLSPADPTIQGFVLNPQVQGLAGFTVQLYSPTGTLIATTTTTTSGWYAFRFSKPGTYTLRVYSPATASNPSASITVTVRQFQTVTTNFTIQSSG